MRIVGIGELASDMAALLGESLLPECQPEESPFPDLEKQVRILAPIVLETLIMESEPFDLMDAAGRIDSEIRIDSEGMVTLELPDDFLRLICLKMSDWQRPVTSITTVGNPLFYRQGSRWKGIRGTPEHPVALPGFTTDGKGALHLYSSKTGATLEQALYIPRPSLSAKDELKVPSALYPSLLLKLTEWMKGSEKE